MIRSPLAAQFVLAPNIEPRRGRVHPDMIVLHYTGMVTAERAIQWLCAPESRVSCHYLVDEKGAITQMVGEEMRAWHAGHSSWEGETDTNSRSIGIEIHNPGHTMGYPEFPAAQMRAVIALCKDILSRHDIAPRRVLAHSDVAPFRKADPGEKFDWAWLAREGIGLWVQAAEQGGPALHTGETGEAVAALQSNLKQYGYGIEVSGEYDRHTNQVVTAFQRHFRPKLVNGAADRSTVETLHRLLAAL